MPLALDTITDADGFAELADTWNALVLAQDRPSPFFLHGWLHEWIRAYADTVDVRVHLARRDGRLVAALPLVVQRKAGLRLAAFVGGTQSALGDLLVADGDLEAARAVAGHAAGADHDLADLFGLPAGSNLAAALPARALRLIERVEAPVLDLSAGWEAVYAAKTGSKKRNQHKRRRRQLAEQGRELTTEVARTLDELEPALEDAFRLHELRRTGRPDGSGFVTERGKPFHRAALRRIAEDDVPRIVTLKLDGRPIAFHYYFLLANRMYVHRLAFDPEFARLSPGLVNTLDALEAAAAEGAQLVEYLGGDERYKLELSDRLEPLHQGLGLARTPQGHAVVAARLGIIHSQRRLKRSATVRRVYVEGLAPLRRSLARVRRRDSASE
jgi:CelD/BcsL family acetyltransferase involved in cellulose biosynthesis